MVILENPQQIKIHLILAIRSKTCSENAVDCSQTGQQNIDTYETQVGSDATACCVDISGMCTGNTTSSTDITDQQCIDNRYSGLKEEPNTITISAPETQYNDCCISINGMCTGNTDINEDVFMYW